MVVCPIVPHPPQSGGQKRTLRLLETMERAGLRPHVVRDTLTTSFVGMGAITVAALALTGTREAVPDAPWIAALVPLTAAGQLAGRPLFARLAAARSYERVLTMVLVVTVVAGLIGVLL